MDTLLFLTIFSLLTKPLYAYSTGVNYIAKFDNIKTASIPSPYMGLNYTNFAVSKAKTYLNPKSAPNMIASTDLFDMEIDVVSTRDYYYGTLNSLYMACLSCVGSECGAGFYPLPCNVTVVGYVEGFPETQTYHGILEYIPPPMHGTVPQNPNMTMTRVVPQMANGPISGSTFRLFFSGGVIGSTVYFDNINYSFGG